MTTQAAFAAALLDPSGPVPAGLVAWNHSDPASRYAVYRNNVAVSLVTALRDTFPVCCERIGEVRFRALALRFVRSAPPRSPLLAAYGAGFPAFIAQSDLAAMQPELADLARLEFLRVQAYHAADAEALSPARLTAVLAQPEQLPGLRFDLHPSLATLSSDHPIVSVWAAHQGLVAFDSFDPAAAQNAVIVRTGLEVDVLEAASGVVDLLRRIGAGMPLGRSAAAAAEAHADFDLTASLAYLIRHRLLAAVHTPVEESR